MTNQMDPSKHSCKYHRLEDRTSTSNWPVSKSERWRDIKDSHSWDTWFRSVQKYRYLLEEWMVRGRERTGHWVGEWASEWMSGWNNSQTNGKKGLWTGIMNTNSVQKIGGLQILLKRDVTTDNSETVWKLFNAREEVHLKWLSISCCTLDESSILMSQSEKTLNVSFIWTFNKTETALFSYSTISQKSKPQFERYSVIIDKQL